MEAKSKLKSLRPTKALTNTLDMIAKACVSKDENVSNFICYGGLISLYMYDTAKQDALILSRIKTYPKKVRSLIFNYHFYWIHNRPNPLIWIDYVLTADLDWQDSYQKQFIADEFKKTISEIDVEPWALRDQFIPKPRKKGALPN